MTNNSPNNVKGLAHSIWVLDSIDDTIGYITPENWLLDGFHALFPHWDAISTFSPYKDTIMKTLKLNPEF
jgi:hypothetical protein